MVALLRVGIYRSYSTRLHVICLSSPDSRGEIRLRSSSRCQVLSHILKGLCCESAQEMRHVGDPLCGATVEKYRTDGVVL